MSNISTDLTKAIFEAGSLHWLLLLILLQVQVKKAKIHVIVTTASDPQRQNVASKRCFETEPEVPQGSCRDTMTKTSGNAMWMKSKQTCSSRN